jgi:hypothetical protein
MSHASPNLSAPSGAHSVARAGRAHSSARSPLCDKTTRSPESTPFRPAVAGPARRAASARSTCPPVLMVGHSSPGTPYLVAQLRAFCSPTLANRELVLSEAAGPLAPSHSHVNPYAPTLTDHHVSISIHPTLSPLSTVPTHFAHAKSFRMRSYVIKGGGHPLPLFAQTTHSSALIFWEFTIRGASHVSAHSRGFNAHP